MNKAFKAKYEVEDGYCGGSRPQSFTIRPDDIDVSPFMTDEKLEDIFYQLVDEDMQQKISACKVNADEFVAWVRALPSEEEA